MNWYRKNPLFAAALTLCALLVLGEGWFIYDRFAASRAAAKKLVQRESELMAMKDLAPVPTRPVATAIEADLARAQRAVAAMQAELKGRGPAAERLATAKLPAARTEAYFDLATFVEKTRELAKKNDVEIRPEAARFGFALYTNEGPKEDRIASVFHQRQVIQYIVESLIEARPRAIFSVQRERALNKSEKEALVAAQMAAAATGGVLGAPPPESAPGSGSPAEPESPDIFAVDPRVSARSIGYIDTTPVRIVFTGQTGVLRAFLNKLASFELPVLVREVEVDRANAEETAAAAPVTTAPEEGAIPEDASVTAPASVVLKAKPKVAAVTVKAGVPAAPKRPAAAPMVSKPLSKFIVTVEYLNLVPAPGAAPEAVATDAKPST
ncbi:MAG: Amuc_1100 family pilus-like protein [Verrucomicrobia bacterium]|nr:Amuc_1100 family pilus-like protein [Verrucomicrobiota bacterium]